jgi:hypothetical protein
VAAFFLPASPAKQAKVVAGSEKKCWWLSDEVAFFVLLYLYQANFTTPKTGLYFTLLYEIICYAGGRIAGPARAASPNQACPQGPGRCC